MPQLWMVAERGVTVRTLLEIRAVFPPPHHGSPFQSGVMPPHSRSRGVRPHP
jgi:hypothetical protein